MKWSCTSVFMRLPNAMNCSQSSSLLFTFHLVVQFLNLSLDEKKQLFLSLDHSVCRADYCEYGGSCNAVEKGNHVVPVCL